MSDPAAIPASGGPCRVRTSAAARRLRRLSPSLLALACVVHSACAVSEGRDATARLNQRRLEIMQRFALAQNEIRNTQAEALGDPDLQPLQERFNELLRNRIIEIDASADSLLEHARDVGDRMEEMSRPIVLPQGEEPPAYDRAALVSEFRAVERALQPLQQQAMADPEVFAAFTALQDSLHATMLRLDPDVGPILIRMEALSAELEEVDAQLRALPDPTG